jgi:histone H3/H4
VGRGVDVAAVAEIEKIRHSRSLRRLALPKLTSTTELSANVLNFAAVVCIMKTTLPDNTKTAKGAKVCMQECVGEYIFFITRSGKQSMVRTSSSQWPLWALRTIQKR